MNALLVAAQILEALLALFGAFVLGMYLRLEFRRRRRLHTLRCGGRT